MSALHYLATVILIALFITFSIHLSEKQGIRVKLIEITARYDLLHKMLQCDFCLGFWSSLILGIIIGLLAKNLTYLAIPVFSTPIIRYLLN